MSQILGLIVTFAPLLVILLAANLAEQRREHAQPHEGMALLSYLLIALPYVFGLIIGLMLQLVMLIAARQPSLLGGLSLAGGTAPFRVDSLALLGLGLWLPSLAGLILLLPPTRRLLSSFLPIDAASPIDAIGLAFSMLVVINLMLTLGVGLDNLATLVKSNGSASQGSDTLISLWLQQILTAGMAMVGVGWLTRRNIQDTLKRLGIVAPTRRQISIGVGVGLTMVPIVMLLEYASTLIGVKASPDVQNLTEQLLGPLFHSPFGIFTLGVSAALGEETLFRGAVLPRFGLILSSLLFALLHSNYGITLSTGIVFILGMVLGWVRIRQNTTTSMIVHAVYNMTLGLLAYLSIGNF